MTARKHPNDRKPMGPTPNAASKRPTQYCTNTRCRAVFRRRANYDNPCPHCGCAVTTQATSAPPTKHYHRMTFAEKQAYLRLTENERRAHKREAPAADYERHSIVIAGATSEWTEERIKALLQTQREEVISGKR